jgi:hypothetical protein
MANTLTITSLAENIFRARDKVARELTGFVGSVMINSDTAGVSKNGTVTSFKTGKPTLNTSYTPAMTIPAADDQTVEADSLQLTEVANVKIPLTGEDARKLENTAGQAVIDDMFAQAIRQAVNAIEVHVGTVAKNGSSRAYGTAGTTPFASDHKPVNFVRQILADNGCPLDGQVSLVMDTLAGTNLRNLSNLYQVNTAGNDSLLRQGVLQDISGIMLKESAGIATHTKGTLAGSPTSNSAGFLVGATSITLTAAGTGTIVTGDALSIANDTGNVYIVQTGDTDVSDGGTIVINAPGLRKATGASARALTLAANYTANVAFHKSAIELAMRPPAQPAGGDAAVDRMTIYDDKTGLVFEAAIYKGYGMQMIDITVFYKAKVWKPEFVATLLG